MILNAHWKIAQEAFFEGWHVMQTHPQLTLGAGTEFPPNVAEHLIFENGHSLFRTDRVRTGSFGVNQPYRMDPAAPFGGVKASGIGRELGREGLEAYVDIKAISGAPAS